MDNHLPPERVEQLITAAIRRGRRQQKFQRVARGVAALVVVAAVAVGAGNLLNGADSREATPATTPDASSLPARTPSPTASTSTVEPAATTAAPSPDPQASSDFSIAYTEAEQEVILQKLSGILIEHDPEGFTAVVSRTTWVDGLTALDPDVEITGADDTPAFALRVSGPFGETPISSCSTCDPETAELVGTDILFSTDGKGYTSALLYQAPDGSNPTMPPIDTRYEHDAAIIDLQQETLPTLATEPPALSDEEQSLADELLTTVENLLPSGVEVTEVLNSTPDGAVFTLQGAQSSARGTIDLWHLTPGADLCQGSDCTAVPVDDGTVYIDDTFDSPEAPTRFYTYRRNDDAAIYFTMNITPKTNQGSGHQTTLPLTQDQMVPLLTDPGWTTFLDRKKAEPPQ